MEKGIFTLDKHGILWILYIHVIIFHEKSKHRCLICLGKKFIRSLRQWGTGYNKYERRTSKSTGAFSICNFTNSVISDFTNSVISDFANSLNARSRFSWYWLSMPCDIVKETVLLTSPIALKFCRVTRSKKYFWCLCFKHFYMNVYFRVFPNSSAWRMYFSISSETGAQMRGNIIFLCPLSSTDL